MEMGPAMCRLWAAQAANPSAGDFSAWLTRKKISSPASSFHRSGR
jgi:hypothetical protein